MPKNVPVYGIQDGYDWRGAKAQELLKDALERNLAPSEIAGKFPPDFLGRVPSTRLIGPKLWRMRKANGAHT